MLGQRNFKQQDPTSSKNVQNYSKPEAKTEEKPLTGCEFQKCSSFHSQNELWSDLKKLFNSYLLQLREARRREEVAESYFMDLSHSSGELQHLLLP